MNTPSDRSLALKVTQGDWEKLPLTYQAFIPEDYIDMMGHMNVMWYTHLFGHSIGRAFEIIGMNRDYFQSNHYGTFALKQYVSYWNEVRVGEQISVRTRLLGRSAKRLHVMHFMIKEQDQSLAATSEVLLMHMDLSIRRSSPFPDEISQIIDRILAEHTALNWSAPLAGRILP